MLVEKYDKAVKFHISSTCTPYVAKQEPWVTQEVIEAVESKRVLWAKYIAAGRNTHAKLREEHRKACKIVTKVVKNAVREYEETLVLSSKSDHKRLFAYVKNKQYINEMIRSLEIPDGTITKDQK